jgi:hypothetical protein
MDSPIALPGRFVLKGRLGGHTHHVDAFEDQGPAIDAAEQVYGYDVVIVIDARAGCIVWDSEDAQTRLATKFRAGAK